MPIQRAELIIGAEEVEAVMLRETATGIVAGITDTDTDGYVLDQHPSSLTSLLEEVFA